MSKSVKSIIDEALANADPAVLMDAKAQIDAQVSTLNIAIAVRNARIAAGLTQAELAEKCEITQTQLSRIEKSVFEPRMQTLMALSKALEIQFLIGANPPTAPSRLSAKNRLVVVSA